MAGVAKKGTRHGGRAQGSRNRATIERENRELQALAGRAAAANAAGKKFVIAKDELFDLIPIVKGTVAEFQKAAIGANGAGMPGKPGFDAASWERLRDWMEFFEKVCRNAADFQSPKFRAIAVQMTQELPSAPKVINAEPTDELGRERHASNAYLKLVKG